jgi:CDP-diacylglycerol--serine O-phosphatidyltransferase
MEGAYYEAAWLIVLCVLLDKADGTAARLLKATSAIGVQLDSFSDFVTFGIAPATLVYMALWQDPDQHFVIWQGVVATWVLRVLVAIYVLCACIRLAKFNVLSDETDGDMECFYGLATTLCGATIALCYLVGVQYEAWDLLRWLPVAGFGLGVLMVSNFPMPTLGATKSKFMNGFIGLNVVAAYTLGMTRLLPEYLLGMYLIGGFVWGLRHREALKPRRLDPYPES